MFVLAFAFRLNARTAPLPISPATMNANTRALFEDSMAMGDRFYDDSAKLLKNPSQDHTPSAESNMYRVRESSWYALGLLERDAPGDRKRAAEILDAVLKQQLLTPGAPWYGTFRRTPEEPDPQPGAVMWQNFDPNWRVFIGTTFEIILVDYPDRISPELAQRMYAAIDRALEGEIAEKRLLPSYTNIALMYGALWDFAAVHDKRADWKQQSAEWSEAVYKLYKKYGTFFEYNSPTYCGVDLYGLALWRNYGSTPRMRALGSEMETGLWRDTADLYQPQLRNISGPFDRAYGMDMQSYVSIVGVWMRTALAAQTAPLPPITPTTDHLADIWFAAHLAALGTRIPADALKKITAFAGEHLVSRRITDQRSATAWIGNNVIFGGEATSKTKEAEPGSQFHPATIQWRTPSGKIGWVQLYEAPMINATADRGGITISATGTIRIRIHALGLDPARTTPTQWNLPGLKVAVSADNKKFAQETAGEDIDLTYSGMTQARWEITPVQ